MALDPDLRRLLSNHVFVQPSTSRSSLLPINDLTLLDAGNTINLLNLLENSTVRGNAPQSKGLGIDDDDVGILGVEQPSLLLGLRHLVGGLGMDACVDLGADVVLLSIRQPLLKLDVMDAYGLLQRGVVVEELKAA